MNDQGERPAVTANETNRLRLQGQARPGQIVLSDRVRHAIADRYPNAQPVELQLRGRDAPVRAWVVDFGVARAAA